MRVTQRVALGREGNAIVVSHLTFDEEGFNNGQVTGILAISPDQNPVEMLAKAAKKEWRMVGDKNIQGFYGVEKVRDLNAEELATAKTGARSYQVVIDSEIAEGEDITHSTTNTPSQRGNNLSATLPKLTVAAE